MLLRLHVVVDPGKRLLQELVRHPDQSDQLGVLSLSEHSVKFHADLFIGDPCEAGIFLLLPCQVVQMDHQGQCVVLYLIQDIGHIQVDHIVAVQVCPLSHLSPVTPLLSYLALPSHPLLRILYIRSIFAQFSDYSSCYNKLYAIALFGPAAGPGMHV